jgi:AcrR family transcriptional regulator
MVINAQESEVSDSHNRGPATLVPDSASEGSFEPPAMGRRQRRAAETRLRLFRCALQLFAERGYSNVTVENITEAADVGKGTFFNYFESKDQVLGVMAEIQLGKAAEALARVADSKQTIHAVLHRLFLRLAEEPGRSPELARTIISSFLASKGVRQLIACNMQKGRKMGAEIVAAGQERGEIDTQLQKDKVAMQMMQMIMGTVLFWSLHEEPALKVWMEDSFQHFWRAIAVSDRKQKI